MTERTYFTIAFMFLGLALSMPKICRAGGGEGPSFHSAADFGFGFVDEDGFFLLLLEQGFSVAPIDIRLEAPIGFRAIDYDPQDDGVIREQDWDDASDWARILRSLSVVHEWDDGLVDFYFGELNGVSLGFGAIVDSYYNSTDMDHYQGGAKLITSFAGNGVELMVEDVVYPEILAGRAFVAPISWFVGSGWARRLEIGFSAGADLRAPRRIESDEESIVSTFGGDLSIRVIDREVFTLIPYVELGFMEGSPGFHAGLATNWMISEQRGISLKLRGEYRYLDSDYHPSLFNPFFEYNRYYYPYDVESGSEIPTFADHQADSDDPPIRHGFMLDCGFEWEKGLNIGVRYDSEGAGSAHWLLVRGEVFPSDSYSFALFYGGQDIEGGAGLFSWDALMGVATRVRILGPTSFFAEFTRRWRRVGDQMDFAGENGIGVGISATY